MDVWRAALRRFNLLEPGSSPPHRRYSEEEYELLSSAEPGLVGRPNGNGHHHHPPPRRRSLRSLWFSCLHCWTLRRAIITLSFIPLFLVIGLIWSGIPPSYADIREYERRLPQHNLSLPFPEGRDGMYLRFPDHLWGHGLNNILQETILMSYLAYMSNRSFVFEEYTWSHTPLPWTIYDFALRPARIPLNSFISGPTAGGPMPAPRAINAEYWEKVCPRQKRRVVSSKGAPSNAEGDELIRWWVEKLKGIEDGCVEVESTTDVVFDRFLFGSTRILSLWPSLSSSPILADYTWSPLVQSTVSRNFALLQPLSVKSLFDISSKTTLKGLVAVHLRRGDYKRHCPRLAEWDSRFMGINQAPSLPDKFDPSNLTAPAVEPYYLEHCLPTVEQIVAKLRVVRAERPELGLRRVYVLTNGWGWWVNGLKKALVDDGWDDLKSSLDLVLDGEQEYVAMAVDMAIAEKAEVFVGNGFSSLSSNVVMLRMAKGLDVESNRFL